MGATSTLNGVHAKPSAKDSLAVRQRDNGISGGMQVYFLMCEVVKTGASLKADILRVHERNDIMGRAMSVIQGNYPYARAGQTMTRNFCCRGEEPYARVPEANGNQRDFAGATSRTHDCDWELKKSRFAMPR